MNFVEKSGEKNKMSPPPPLPLLLENYFRLFGSRTGIREQLLENYERKEGNGWIEIEVSFAIGYGRESCKFFFSFFAKM